MENNGVILIKLEYLIEMLDARKTINIFKNEKESLKYCKVYELLADPAFIKEYGNREVKGIIYATFDIINVLIEEV